MPRFTLKRFFIAIALISLVTATLLWPATHLLTTLAFVTWASIVVAAIQVLIFGPAKRPFAVGYTVTCLAFLSLSLLPRDSNLFKTVDRAVHEFLTDPLHEALLPIYVNRHRLPGESVKQLNRIVVIRGRVVYHPGQDLPNIESTVHLMATAILGLLGGALAMSMKKRDETTAHGTLPHRLDNPVRGAH